MTVAERSRVVRADSPTNGAEGAVKHLEPYAVEMEVEGACRLIFHRWNVEAVNEKAAAKKGSAAKKTDDLESYVWRNKARELCIPGEYLRMALVNAAKFKQDPRSPRKSAMDLFKAGLLVSTELASLGKTDWDLVDTRRCVVQRSGINRSRPAMEAGWRTKFVVEVILPEYIDTTMLREVVDLAGRVVGLADFRPTYGRFNVTGWNVRKS
jgi:hypothetical protein